MTESVVFLSLGGNLGDPRGAMATALQAIDADPQSSVIRVSSLYRTPPWGKIDQPDFLNAAAEIRTIREPRDFLQLCLQTERELKRVRAERWGPRAIDIDILLFNDFIVKEEGLEIPHPRIAERAFVLVPLAEIAPDIKIADITARAALKMIDVSGIERLPGAVDWWRTST